MKSERKTTRRHHGWLIHPKSDITRCHTHIHHIHHIITLKRKTCRYIYIYILYNIIYIYAYVCKTFRTIVRHPAVEATDVPARCGSFAAWKQSHKHVQNGRRWFVLTLVHEDGPCIDWCPGGRSGGRAPGRERQIQAIKPFFFKSPWTECLQLAQAAICRRH